VGVPVASFSEEESEEDWEDGVRERCRLLGRGGRREDEENAGEKGRRKAAGPRLLRRVARKGRVAVACRGSSSSMVAERSWRSGEEDRGEEGRLVDGRMHQGGLAGLAPPVWVVEGEGSGYVMLCAGD